MSTESQKLEKLIKQQEQLKARIQTEKARITKEKRKIETRMKILAGAYMLDHYKNNMDALRDKLDGFLTREQDRKLFGLEKKPDIENKQSPS